MPNPNSISARSAAAAKDGGILDLLGSSPDNFKTPSFDALTETLVELAALYVEKATENLNKADKVSSGALADSIIASPVQVLGKTYTINISLASYYKFVDEGVDGWNQSQGSQYKFKQYTGKSGKKNSPMVTAIRKWLIREGLQAKAVNKSKTPFPREKRGANITDTSTKTAIIVAKSIRKKGIKATHFWTKTEQEMIPVAKLFFGKAIKIDIINSLS